MKKVILTGASGFVGRQATPFLLKHGFEVHAVFHHRKPDSKKKPGLIWHECDLLNLGQQARLFKSVGATHLLHFAWIVDHKTYLESNENYQWVDASLRMLENFALNRGQRAVFTGSCFEYDLASSDCLTEEAPLKAFSLYGESKTRLMRSLEKKACSQDVSFAWGRIFFLYGPYEQPTRLIPYLILALLRNQNAECRHGDVVRDFLYVKDAAAAFVSLLDSPVAGAVNIASGRPAALGKIGAIIAEKLNRKGQLKIGKLAEDSQEPRFIAADVTRLKKEVGWEPAYNLETGLDETIGWWKKELKGM